MRNRLLWRSLIVSALVLGTVYAAGPPSHNAKAEVAKDVVRQILNANSEFVKAHEPGYFTPFIDSQQPVATVVCCSDSRVQMHALDANADNRLFVIRNIGNQLATAQGSVEYGVHHLHTPVLLIVGHVRCGAVKAAMGDYSTESPALKRELDTLKPAKGGDWLENVKANVNDQVKEALALFGRDVKEGTLTVIGAVYDFADDLKQGSGRLVLVNVNGETAPATIKAFLEERAGPKK